MKESSEGLERVIAPHRLPSNNEDGKAGYREWLRYFQHEGPPNPSKAMLGGQDMHWLGSRIISSNAANAAPYDLVQMPKELSEVLRSLQLDMGHGPLILDSTLQILQEGKKAMVSHHNSSTIYAHGRRIIPVPFYNSESLETVLSQPEGVSMLKGLLDIPYSARFIAQSLYAIRGPTPSGVYVSTPNAKERLQWSYGVLVFSLKEDKLHIDVQDIKAARGYAREVEIMHRATTPSKL